MMIALVCARIISQMIQPNNIKPSSLCVGVVNTSRGAAAKRSIDADAACMQSSAGATDYSAKVLLSRNVRSEETRQVLGRTPIACQAIPELNAGVALRLLISMNQNKRSFARRATASKRKSSHHNARSRKHIWFHMVWSRLEQCVKFFVVHIAEFVWDVCTDKSNIRYLGPIAARRLRGSSALGIPYAVLSWTELADASFVGPMMDWIESSSFSIG